MVFKNFLKAPQREEYFNTLHKTLREKFPEDNEEQLIESACTAGLLTSVAYIDFDINPNEQNFMEESLTRWMGYSTDKARIIAELAISDAKELSGVENYTYTEALSRILDENDRYEILEVLFELSASDGGVSERESEEIRIICRGLKLEHKHFISARATVLQYLDSL